MAPEVRCLPPGLILTLLLAAAPVVSSPAKAQETGTSRQSPGPVQEKARLLQELDEQIEQKRGELAREEEALEALNRALERAKQELLKERERLEALKAEIEADIGRREMLVDERLSQIAKVYGAMKPKEAALAIEGMEDDMAVAILERLPGRTVGKIFNLMPKDRVRDLTRVLEGRSAEGE